MKMNANVHYKRAFGRYTVKRVEVASGKVVAESKCQNVVFDQGMEFIYGDFFGNSENTEAAGDYLYFSDNAVEAVAGDTTLGGNQNKTSQYGSLGYRELISGEHYIRTHTRAYIQPAQVSVGTVPFTVRKIGVGSSSVLCAGQLIKDEGGNPVSYEIDAQHALYVEYDVFWHRSTDGGNDWASRAVAGAGTLTTKRRQLNSSVVDGTDVTWELRCAEVTKNDDDASLTRPLQTGIRVCGFTNSSTSSSTSDFFGNGSVATVVTRPTAKSVKYEMEFTSGMIRPHNGNAAETDDYYGIHLGGNRSNKTFPNEDLIYIRWPEQVPIHGGQKISDLQVSITYSWD